MDYKVKYEQAIADARAIIKDYKERHLDDIAKRSEEDFSAVFPELKESEDEKIRKGLIEYFKDFRLGTFAYLEPKKIIAWLERQGEEIIPLKEIILNVWELGNYWKDLTKGVCNTEHGTQLDYILKHWTEGEHYTKLLDKQDEQILANSVKTCKDEQKPWREEDENHIQHISDFIMRNRVGDTDAIYRLEQDVKWLKSIKDRYAWKPSDEHIHGLIWVINRMPDIKNANEAEAVLRDLLEQLNKLRKG